MQLNNNKIDIERILNYHSQLPCGPLQKYMCLHIFLQENEVKQEAHATVKVTTAAHIKIKINSYNTYLFNFGPVQYCIYIK